MKVNKIFFYSLFSIGLVILIIKIANPYSLTKTYQYTCDDNKLIKATYKNRTVYIELSDDREFTLDQIMSASGIKYSNKNKTIIFWSKGKTSFFQENNSIIYSNCIEDNK